ncbi:hypothetical protein, partial [Allokutzneria sp. NRRL B-24872]|uniref:hypothetical protein n=1 Tax=Allokutzneria sp. NRRL B-24872 TaxID=1137961 RepID=UPI001AEFF5BD
LDDSREAEDEDSSWPVIDPDPEPRHDVVDEFEDEPVADEDHPAPDESPEPAFFEAPTTQFPVIVEDGRARLADDEFADDPDYSGQETSFSADELETRAAQGIEPADDEYDLPSGLLPSVVGFTAMPDSHTASPAADADAADLDDDLVEITDVRLADEPDPLPEAVVESYHRDRWSEPDELELSALPSFSEPEPEPELEPEADATEQAR